MKKTNAVATTQEANIIVATVIVLVQGAGKVLSLLASKRVRITG